MGEKNTQYKQSQAVYQSSKQHNWCWRDGRFKCAMVWFSSAQSGLIRPSCIDAKNTYLFHASMHSRSFLTGVLNTPSKYLTREGGGIYIYIMGVSDTPTPLFGQYISEETPPVNFICDVFPQLTPSQLHPYVLLTPVFVF